MNLALRKQLEAAASPAEREKMFRQAVEFVYERGKARSAVSFFELDDVIDPAASRDLIAPFLIDRSGDQGSRRDGRDR